MFQVSRYLDLPFKDSLTCLLVYKILDGMCPTQACARQPRRWPSPATRRKMALSTLAGTWQHLATHLWVPANVDLKFGDRRGGCKILLASAASGSSGQRTCKISLPRISKMQNTEASQMKRSCRVTHCCLGTKELPRPLVLEGFCFPLLIQLPHVDWDDTRPSPEPTQIARAVGPSERS